MESLRIDDSTDEPPYEQVRRHIAAAVAAGTLGPGHKLPTVRALAAELGVAAGTVARAYRTLEMDGLIETNGRKGTFVASQVTEDSATLAAVEAFIRTARRRGLSLDQAIRLVTDGWSA